MPLSAAEELDQKIEGAVELAVGAKYAKKVRKRLAAVLEPPEADQPATAAAPSDGGGTAAGDGGAGSQPAMPETHRMPPKQSAPEAAVAPPQLASPAAKVGCDS